MTLIYCIILAGDKMNKKVLIIGLVVVLLAIILFSNGFIGESTEVSGDYDTAYYVEDNGNVFIKIAKFMDKCCFYVVDVVVSGVGSIFSAFLGS